MNFSAFASFRLSSSNDSSSPVFRLAASISSNWNRYRSSICSDCRFVCSSSFSSFTAAMVRLVQLSVGTAKRGDRRFIIHIQPFQMTLGLQQGLMLMLSMDIHEPFADFPQHRQIYHLPVDAAAALSLGRDLPADDQRFTPLSFDPQVALMFPIRDALHPVRTSPRSLPLLPRGGSNPPNPVRRPAALSASMIIDLPAPVSPVSTWKPRPKLTCTSSITARLRIESSSDHTLTPLCDHVRDSLAQPVLLVHPSGRSSRSYRLRRSFR